MKCLLTKTGWRRLGAPLVLTLCLLTSSAAAQQADGSGLQISAAVDAVGTFRTDKKTTADDAFFPREAEIMLFAPVDHLFDGMLSFAAHREAGEMMAELHEAYVSSSKLIPRSRLKVGQFFLGIGRLNQFHRHDWPFISTPLVHGKFLDDEGVLDSGIEYGFLAPTPFFLDVTLGVTNGFTYGHSHTAGNKPRKPTHYGRTATYFDGPYELGTQTGVSYLGRTAADGTETQLTGLDWTTKLKQEKTLVALLQAEVWHRRLQPKGAKAQRSLGSYVYPQYGFSPQWMLGVRYDYLTVLSLQDVTGKKVDNAETAVVPTVTYKPSEFSTFRFGWTASERTQKGMADVKQQYAEVQATFILGAHPAHDF